MFLINCPFCGEREQSEFKADARVSPLKPKYILLLNLKETL